VVEDIESLADRFGLQLSWDQIRRLEIFLDQLEAWNRKINLTGLRSRRRIINELLIDSLIPATLIPHTGRLLDIGSGAGFPAVPIKISRPCLECLLLEPASKKVSFLKQVVRAAGLQKIGILRGRIEEAAAVLNQKGYHVITSRAVVPLPGLIRWAVPHLAPGGMIVAFLGRNSERVMEESADLIDKHHLFTFRSISYLLPGKGLPRTILSLKRKGQTDCNQKAPSPPLLECCQVRGPRLPGNGS